jgi:uncharacterized SAM-dependent methyltransferase
MALSKKRQRELDDLKDTAADVWEDQKDVIERANRVIRAAGKRARTQVANRGHDVLDSRVRPVVEASREHFSDDVVPALSSALGSALAIIEAAKKADVRAAVGKAASAGKEAAAKTGLVKAKPSPGPGRYILIGVGLVAAAGIAYAAWQTLRADDDLWIDDEELTEGAVDQPS